MIPLTFIEEIGGSHTQFGRVWREIYDETRENLGECFDEGKHLTCKGDNRVYLLDAETFLCKNGTCFACRLLLTECVPYF